MEVTVTLLSTCWDLVDLVELEVLADMGLEDWLLLLVVLSLTSNMTWGHSMMEGSMA